MCHHHMHSAGRGLAPAVPYPSTGYYDYDEDSMFIPNEDDFYCPKCDLSGRTTPDDPFDWLQQLDEQDSTSTSKDPSPQRHFENTLVGNLDSETDSEEDYTEWLEGMTHVRSLKDLATKACIRNSGHLVSVGQLPYSIVRPILLAIENHEQLRQIELASPQIIGDDAEIWRKLILRDIPGAKKDMVEPVNPANWYKVYKKLKKGEDQALEAATKALTAGFKAANAPKEAMRAGTITGTPPKGTKRGSAMVLGGRPDQPKILKYSTRTKSGDRFSNVRQANRPGHIVRDVGMPTVSRSVASNTTGKGILDRAKQEAKIVKTYRKATPTHMLNYFKNPKSQITSVPKTMVSSSASATTARQNREQSSNAVPRTGAPGNNTKTSAGPPQSYALR